MITQLGYVGLGVKDTRAWEDFAVNILGFEVSEKLPDGTLYLRMDEYNHRFILEPNGNDDINYSGWMVATRAGLDDIKHRLQTAGVKFEQGTPAELEHRRIVDMIKFHDPDGLRVEVSLASMSLRIGPSTLPATLLVSIQALWASATYSCRSKT